MSLGTNLFQKAFDGVQTSCRKAGSLWRAEQRPPRAPSGRPLLAGHSPYRCWGLNLYPPQKDCCIQGGPRREVPGGGPPPHHTWGPRACSVLGRVCTHVCACNICAHLCACDVGCIL